jgi:uncharacterized UPF0160 family protein
MNTIVTHNHSFHADDVFACATLLLLFKDASIIRTRDPQVIANADIVLDVGLMYDEEKNRFDHHQKGGALTRENGIPYASFGLVWKKFGSSLCGGDEIASVIEKKLVMPIDAIDSGKSVSKSLFEDVSDYSLSSVIGAMNPTSFEVDKTYDKEFLKAVDFAKMLIEREIAGTKEALAFKEYFLDEVKKSPDPRYVILEKEISRYIWQQYTKDFPELLFVVVPREETWSLRAVRKDSSSFENRKDLPLAWSGKSNEELQEVTGVKDALFCHNGRFVASTKTKEGILTLLEQALKE